MIQRCTQARDFLNKPDAEAIPSMVEHLAHCAVCQEFFTDHEAAFSQALEADPLGELGSLATVANQRLEETTNQPRNDAPNYWPAPEIEGYRLDHQIALTKQSQVFVATQLSLGRPVAMKIIRAKGGARGTRNLSQEAQIQANLKHPNILNIYETGTWESGVWLALEYCPRGSLSDMLESREQWDPREAASLIRKVALGVHTANANGLVHRDIKPANILIGPGEEPKLADFGFAQAVDRNTNKNAFKPMAGTPAYMAPEQVQGGIVDARSDVHALGAVLYHLLAGRPPFGGDAGYDALLQVAHTMPMNPWYGNQSLSRDLCEICMKCLAKDPDQRYQTARDLALDLERYLLGKPVQARPLTQWEAAKRWVIRNKTKAAVVGAGLAFLAISAVGFALLSLWAMTEKNRAVAEEGRAETMRVLAEREAYAGKIQVANTEWDFGAPNRTRYLLESCPFHLRGWEFDYLSTQLNQDQVTFSGHQREVHALAADPDGKWVASASMDGTIRFWDLATGNEAAPPIEVGEPLYGLFLSQNKKILGVGTEKRAFHFYDLKKRTKLTAFKAIEGNTDRWVGEAGCLNPDGTLFFCEGENHALVARDTATGKIVRNFETGHTHWIRTVAITQDGSRIATGGTDQKIILWETATGKRKQEFSGHRGLIRCICFSPDGRELISSGNDNSLQVWSTETGKLKVSHERAHKDWILALAYSPDGRFAASGGSDQTIRVWETRNWGPVRLLKGHSALVRALCFLPGSGLLASASWDKGVKVWNFKERTSPTGPLNTLPIESEARCAQFNPSGKILAVGSEKGSIYLYNRENNRLDRILEGHTDQLQDLSFHPDGEYLASCSRDMTVRVWRVSTGECVSTVNGLTANIYKLGYTPDGSKIIFVGGLGRIGILDADGKKPPQLIPAHEGQIRAMAFSPDGQYLATGGDDLVVRVWRLADWSIRAELRGHAEQVRSIAFNKAGTRVISGSLGTAILVWDLETGKQVMHLHGHLDGVTFVAYHPEESRIISGSFDRTLKIWNAEDGQELLTLSRHTGGIRDGALSPDGSVIATASDDRSTILWKAGIGLERQSFQGKFGLVRDAVFLGHEEILAVRDPVGRQRFWDLGKNKEVLAPFGPVDWEMWERPKVESADGKWLLEVQDQELYLVNLALRRKREAEERRRLKEWAKGSNGY